MEKSNNSGFEKKVEDFVALLKSGGAIADVAGITDEQLESLYALAYQNYAVKSYLDAKNIFRALCLYDHTQQRFYMGLAASQQGLGEYADAAQSYSFLDSKILSLCIMQQFVYLNLEKKMMLLLLLNQ